MQLECQSCEKRISRDTCPSCGILLCDACKVKHACGGK